jgi:hypothetical protein
MFKTAREIGVTIPPQILKRATKLFSKFRFSGERRVTGQGAVSAKTSGEHIRAVQFNQLNRAQVETGGK